MNPEPNHNRLVQSFLAVDPLMPFAQNFTGDWYDPNLLLQTHVLESQAAAQLIAATLSLGLHTTPPKHASRELWPQQVDTLIAWAVTSLNLPELGTHLGVTKQNVDYGLNATFTRLVSQLPEDIAPKTFPEPPLDKDYLLAWAYKAQSLLANDHSNPPTGKKITDTLGVKPGYYRKIRARAAENGIDLPPIGKRSAPDLQLFASKLAQAEGADLEALMDTVTANDLMCFARKQEPPLISVDQLGKKAGLFHSQRETHLLYEVLKRSGLPVRLISKQINTKSDPITQKYYVFPTKLIPQAMEILANEPSLEKFRANPVTQIAGLEITGNPPRVWDVVFSDNFSSLTAILTQLGIPINRRNGQVTSKFIGPDCPAPVFSYNGSHYIPKDSVDQLINYIQNHLEIS